MKKISNGILGTVDGICSILFFVFLVLRACDVILWPWWLVCMPIFVAFGISALIILIAVIVAGFAIAKAVSKKEDE